MKKKKPNKSMTKDTEKLIDSTVLNCQKKKNNFTPSP